MKVGRHQGSFTEGHVRAKCPNSFGRDWWQNAFNVDGVWWLEGQTLNSSTNMFLDLMEMAAARRLSDTIVDSCVSQRGLLSPPMAQIIGFPRM